MLYAKYKRPELQLIHSDNAKISSILGKQWQALSPSERKIYQDETKDLNEKFYIQYPSYRYKPVRKGRTSSRKVKRLPKRATVKSATRTPWSSQNPRTTNSSHLSDSTVDGNQNKMTGVQKRMPRVKRYLAKTPLQQEPLQREPLQEEPLQPEPCTWENLQENLSELGLLQLEPLELGLVQEEPTLVDEDPSEWGILHKEPLQWEPFNGLHVSNQQAPVRKPLDLHPLGPLLCQSSSTLPAHSRLPHSIPIDEDAALGQLVIINDMLPYYHV